MTYAEAKAVADKAYNVLNAIGDSKKFSTCVVLRGEDEIKQHAKARAAWLKAERALDVAREKD